MVLARMICTAALVIFSGVVAYAADTKKIESCHCPPGEHRDNSFMLEMRHAGEVIL